MLKLVLKSFIVISVGTILATDPFSGVQAEKGMKPVATPTVQLKVQPSPTFLPHEELPQPTPRVWNW